MDKKDTAIFINKVLIRWKIFNVKTLQIDKLHNEPLQTEIKSLNNSQLDFIIEFGQIALNMAGSQGNRITQLSKHTATTIYHTRNWAIYNWSIRKRILKTSQRSGGTCFINVQQCIEKLHIKQTSLLLNQKVNIDAFDVKPSYQCTFCDYKLCEEGTEIFDNLGNLELLISDEKKKKILCT